MARYNNISAAAGFAVMVMIALMVFPARITVLADVLVVGDDVNWMDPQFDYQAWADAITFVRGDGLEFIYDPGLYDVVVAGSPELFEACSIDHNFGFYHSGHDELIFPVPGTYYFFDTATCLNGNPNMKFFVVVY